MPSNTSNYLSIEEYGQLFDLRRINCLATSFIRRHNLKHQLLLRIESFKMDSAKEIGEAYLSKVDELQEYLGYNRQSLKRIPMSELSKSTANEFRLVYGFQKRTVTIRLYSMEYDDELDDFHIIIGVRDSSGKVRWYHKFGVSNELPREVTESDWEEIAENYPDCPIPVLFEFEEP